MLDITPREDAKLLTSRADAVLPIGIAIVITAKELAIVFLVSYLT